MTRRSAIDKRGRGKREAGERPTPVGTEIRKGKKNVTGEKNPSFQKSFLFLKKKKVHKETPGYWKKLKGEKGGKGKGKKKRNIPHETRV